MNFVRLEGLTDPRSTPAAVWSCLLEWKLQGCYGGLQCALEAARLSTDGEFPPHCVHWKSWGSADTFELRACRVLLQPAILPSRGYNLQPPPGNMENPTTPKHYGISPLPAAPFHFAIKECISLMKRMTSAHTQWRLSHESAAGLGGSPWVMECMHIVWSGTKLQWLEVTNRGISQTPRRPFHCLHTIVHLLLLSFFFFFYCSC